MPSHEVKQCPRCNSLFECKSGSVLLCQCQTVALTEMQREYIAFKLSELSVPEMPFIYLWWRK